MRPLVVVDATPYRAEPSGARRRLEALLPRVARLRPDAVFEVHWANDGARPSATCAADNLVHAIVETSCRGGARRWWRRGRALARRHDDAPYTHLWTDHGPIVRPDRVRNVVTVHDLRFLHGYGGLLRRWYGRARYGASLAHARRVVAVSDAVRDELASAYGLRNVVVARNAVEAPFAPIPAPQGDGRGPVCGMPPPYALVVGRDEPRKAMRAGVAAWRAARAAGGPGQLFVVGAPALADGDGVRVVDAVPDDALARLYARATWTLVPSLYEGYSLPVAESLACGTPVIASDIAAHRALVADGARGVVLVPPPRSPSFAWPEAAAAIAGARPRDVAPPRSTWDDAARVVAAAID